MGNKKYKAKQQYGGIEAQKRQETRRKTFIKAGLEAFGTTGYARSTIKDICQIAGLTQRYFYESFQDKEDLLVAVYQNLINDIEEEARIIFEQSGISKEDRAYKLLKMFYQKFKNDPRRAQVQLFVVSGVSPRVMKEYQSATQKLANWVKLVMVTVFPEVQKKIDKKTIVFTGGAGAIIQIAQRWALEGLKMPVKKIVDQTFEMFFILGKYYSDKKF